MKHFKIVASILTVLLCQQALSQSGDTYQNAINVPHQTAWETSYSNSGMTLQSPVSSCQNFSLNNSNKWFAFTASSDYVKIKITGDDAGNNTRLIIWELPGSTWTELACGVGTTGLSATYSSLTIGNQYYFSVETRHAGISYNVNITNGDLPGNHVTSAIEVPHIEYWENDLTNTDMTLQIPISTCQNFTLNNSNKWYKFQASSNYAKIEVTGDDAGNNTRIVLWEQSGSAWIELTCKVGTTSLSLENNSLTPNTEYFLSVETRYTSIPYKLVVKGGVFSGYWTSTNGSIHPIELTNKVGIGTDVIPIGFDLAVDGKVIAEEVKVQLSENWPDYVFYDSYELTELNELTKYINREKHLPDIPSAEEIEKEGFELGSMDAKLLKKIEELTLYIIQQNIELVKVKSRLASLENKKE